VRPDATREAIEANFKRLAHDRHPDRGGNHEDMSALNEARSAGLAARR
jgi:curved DNA-binding protein CbpA